MNRSNTGKNSSLKQHTMTTHSSKNSKFDCDIYIRGSYGPANLGDDVLMMTISKLVKQEFPTKRILVSVNNTQLATEFLPQFNYTQLKTPIRCKVAIFGGGGQFFSFKSTDQKNKRNVFNALTNVSLRNIARRAIIEARYGKGVAFEATNTAALSIGIGPFENGENDFNYIRAKNNLDRCSFISVRDEMSQKICKAISPKKSKLYTDLSFLRNLWLAETTQSHAGYSKKQQFGVIPRGWTENQEPAKHLAKLIEIVATFEKKPILISFDAEKDASVIKTLSDFKWLIWNPATTKPGDFLKTIADSCDFLVSTRAHGVMLPAALGIPSIAVRIEPKLGNIQSYFPHGTTLIEPHQLGQLPYILESFSKELESRKTHLANEFNAQETIAIAMRKDFIDWMTHHVH